MDAVYAETTWMQKFQRGNYVLITDANTLTKKNLNIAQADGSSLVVAMRLTFAHSIHVLGVRIFACR